MIEALAGVAAALLISGVLSAHSWPRIAEWEARGFTNLPLSWPLLFKVSTAGAVFSSVAAYFLGASFWTMAAVAVLGWMTVLVTVTDFSTYKIPREPSILAYYLGIPLMVGYALSIGSWAPIAAFGVWMLIPTLLFLFSGGGIGMGDIRLLLLFGTTLSWWVGIEYMFYALIASCLLQLLILFPVALVTGRGKKAARGELEREELAQQGIAVPAGEEDEVAAVEVPQEGEGSEADDKPLKQRLHLPFGPSLMFAYLALGLYSASRSIGTCDIFVMFFC